MKKLLAVVLVTAAWAVGAFAQEIASEKVLELEDALLLALERNPQLRAAHIGVQAAEGLLLQAGTLPNPTLSAEVEDFGGSGEGSRHCPTI